MASEVISMDKDGHYGAAGITNDANKFLKNLRVDPTTGRLLVDATVTITDDTEHAEDSAFVDGSNGKLILAVRQDAETSPVSTNGDYSAFLVDSVGRLKANAIISDGTNTANILKSDGSAAGQNALIVAGGYKEMTGLSAGSLNADLIPSTDVRGYTRVVFDVEGTWSGQLSVQGSMDNSNWFSVPYRGNAADDSNSIIFGYSGIFTVKVNFKYLRVRMTTYTSGTATGTAEFFTSDNYLVPPFFQPADAYQFPNAAESWAFPSSFNGSSWDRQRSVINATNSTGTGIQAAGILGQFDDVSPTAISENQFGNLRMSANRNLYGTIRDAAGNERGLNISSRNAALMEGVTASGNAIAAAPVTGGGRAASTNPTAVTDGQVVNQMFDLKGRAISVLGQFRELRSKQTTTISASTSETTIGTAVSSTFLDLIGLIISNTSATAARIDVRDTTGGSVLFSLYIPAGDVRGFSLPGSSIPQTTVNTNWTAQSSASITDLRILAIFEKNT